MTTASRPSRSTFRALLVEDLVPVLTKLAEREGARAYDYARDLPEKQRLMCIRHVRPKYEGNGRDTWDALLVRLQGTASVGPFERTPAPFAPGEPVIIADADGDIEATFESVIGTRRGDDHVLRLRMSDGSLRTENRSRVRWVHS